MAKRIYVDATDWLGALRHYGENASLIVLCAEVMTPAIRQEVSWICEPSRKGRAVIVLPKALITEIQETYPEIVSRHWIVKRSAGKVWWISNPVVPKEVLQSEPLRASNRAFAHCWPKGAQTLRIYHMKKEEKTAANARVMARIDAIAAQLPALPSPNNPETFSAALRTKQATSHMA